MNDVAARISALSAEQLKMLARRLVDRRPRSVEIRREEGVRETYPLSFSQEGLWFLCRLAPNSTAYNNPIPARIVTSAPLDIGVLERCLTEVVRRHEALRTTFTVAGGEPIQIVNPPFPVRISFEDLRHLPAEEREGEGLRIAVEEGRRPFDLETGPLIRATALRTGDCTYLLLLTPHHLVSDGWSNGILIRELTSLYRSFSVGRPPSLEEPAIRYVDYVLWQRDRLQGEHLDRLLAYWVGRLGGELPLIALPSDRARSPGEDRPGALVTRFVAAASIGRLRQLALDCGATFFEALLSLFYVLLHRYSGQTDLIVGTPVANRTRPETEGLVGLFLNTLCFRVQLDDDPPFSQLLERVQKACREAFDHQELPFERVVQAVCPHRSLEYSPLFQVMFILQNAHRQPVQDDVAITPLKLGYGAAKFDLTLHVEEQEEGARLAGEFRGDLFPESFVKEMLRQYEHLLLRVVDAPGRRIGEHDLAAPEERDGPVQHAVIRADAGKPFLSRFARHVDEAPDAIAVRSGPLALTYRQLDCRANRLANRLRSLGAGAETPVPVIAGRSAEHIIAVLGILKAGAYFVPIDSDWPGERLDFILRDTAARVLVACPGAMPPGIAFDGEIVCTGGGEASSPEAERAPALPIQEDTPAYAIYTSGTTGRPKAVLVGHGALAHYLTGALGKLAARGPLSAVAMSTSAADLGHTNLFVPLATGGTVHVLTREQSLSAETLASYLTEFAVDFYKVVPSHLAALLDCPDALAAKLLPRRLLILAGEPLQPSLVARVRSLSTACELQNHYGPTETTVAVCGLLVPGQITAGAGGLVPIGTPFPHARCYVLDPFMRPVPRGVAGELFIGGPSLARGYLGNPGLTAGSFVPDPFSSVPGARMYRSGDLARWRADGALEYRGRIDDQVKIRGHRAEPLEVTRTLERHPDVSQAVVLPVEDARAEMTLAAYVVPRPGCRPTEDELRSFLRRCLPGYMVPQRLAVLPRLPLGANGKVDRAALLAIGGAGATRTEVAPRDAVELRLASIWEEVLELPQVSVTADFFELGGHSLLAVRLLSRIEATFGKSLPLALLFQEGTIERLAARLRGDPAASTSSPAVAMRTGGAGPTIFFVHPAGGNVLCYRSLAQALPDPYRFSAFQMPPDCEDDLAIEQMAARYVRALLVEQESGPYLLGGWSMGAIVAHEMACQLEEAGHRVALVAILDQPAAPAAPWPDVDDEARDLAVFAIKAASHVGRRSRISYEKLKVLAKEERRRALLDEFLEAGLVPPDTELSPFSMYLEVHRRHTGALRRHSPGTIKGRIVLLRSAEPGPGQTETGEPAHTLGRDMGWAGRTLAPLAIELVPGTHMTMVTPPHVQNLAARLATHVGDALAAHSAPDT